ncbi:MAG: TrmB family transcriptional regulator [Nitrososphaerales archaeon]
MENHLLTEHQSVKEAIASKLKSLGLTGYASKAFLAILETSSISATTICNLTGIPDSKIYYALKELEERGLVIVQHGTPNLYRTLDINSILENLQRQLNEDHAKKVAVVNSLRRQLEPLTKKARSDVDVELAYIIKGFRSITEVMKEAIQEARKEVLLMISSTRLFEDLSQDLYATRERNVSVGVATTDEVMLLKGLRHFSPLKRLLCDCNIVIVDSAKLITASQIRNEGCYAIITRDPALITMSKEYYGSPKCCVAESRS